MKLCLHPAISGRPYNYFSLIAALESEGFEVAAPSDRTYEYEGNSLPPYQSIQEIAEAYLSYCNPSEEWARLVGICVPGCLSAWQAAAMAQKRGQKVAIVLLMPPILKYAFDDSKLENGLEGCSEVVKKVVTTYRVAARGFVPESITFTKALFVTTSDRPLPNEWAIVQRKAQKIHHEHQLEKNLRVPSFARIVAQDLKTFFS